MKIKRGRTAEREGREERTGAGGEERGGRGNRASGKERQRDSRDIFSLFIPSAAARNARL